MNKLTKRLQVIANLVSCRNVCDVGCDHGKLAKYLLDNNMVDYITVSDISMPSLQKAINLLADYRDKSSYIHCDGLRDYKDNVEQCIISGMGGDAIIDIISNSPIAINSFILSPQHNNVEVKKFMLNLGYNIIYDIIIKDKGKFYNIIKCEKSAKIDNFSEFDLIIGKDNFENIDSNAEEFVEKEIIKIEKIVKSKPNKKLQNYLELINEYYKRK